MAAYSDAVVKAALAVAAYLRMDLVVLGSNLQKIVLNAVQGEMAQTKRNVPNSTRSRNMETPCAPWATRNSLRRPARRSDLSTSTLAHLEQRFHAEYSFQREAACLRRSVYNTKPTAETEPMDGRLRQRSTQDRAGGTGQGA